ncbi:glycosyltransferase [Clostridium formicaceticum]|uniref:Glycosyltransferase EpsE n=1 Tax=Clostridium formicaceticum TaxID=1497 RepID=A0AAC9RI86_9CLOT|nr:glycosyltransferase [Clostridium formicaceticum]AOY75660.1 hypothetical protein BJL90_06985 [Clostridium formicaceticum]ARE85975.1 Putative glycosyltransferase EpsE [Clostridium formicaceticum]
MVKVSVLMLTYNHENYIKEAIESVLRQDTSFTYELVIGEDCSTDNTRKIITAYKKEYPDIIKLNLHNRNVGGRKNFISTLPMCQGQYVALLEGDDYWTDEKKLQKQIEFLDNNLDCSFCAHSYKIYNEGTKNFVGDRVFSNAKFNLKDFLKGDANNNREPNQWYMRTLSIMFRKEALDKPPTIWYQVPYGDYIFHILFLEKGLGYCSEEIMGVYRINPNSATNKDPSKHDELILQCRKLALGYVPEKYRHYIQQSIDGLILRKKYSSLMNRLKYAMSREKVIDYFNRKSFNRIAIYGAGTSGNLLANKLENSTIAISFFIDKNILSSDNRTVIKPEEIDEGFSVDAIIITPVFDFDNIKASLLKNKVNAEIISLCDIVENV